MKPLHFLGASLSELKAFPAEVQRKAGFQLNKVQTGQIPAHWKPMTTIGTGVMAWKIRINGEYRVIYVAKFTEAIYVLHVFAKKTPKTAQTDLELAKTRYQQLLKDRQILWKS
jgi:phage-related protein